MIKFSASFNKSALLLLPWLLGCNDKPQLRPVSSAIGLYVYPNPAVNDTSIEVMNAGAESFTLYVFDTKGEKIAEQSSNQSRYLYRLQLNRRPEGTYQVIIKTATALVQQKLVKI